MQHIEVRMRAAAGLSAAERLIESLSEAERFVRHREGRAAHVPHIGALAFQEGLGAGHARGHVVEKRGPNMVHRRPRALGAVDPDVGAANADGAGTTVGLRQIALRCKKS